MVWIARARCLLIMVDSVLWMDAGRWGRGEGEGRGVCCGWDESEVDWVAGEQGARVEWGVEWWREWSGVGWSGVEKRERQRNESSRVDRRNAKGD